MTTILSWVSVDSRGPSSIYIVGDSRITWGTATVRWDNGRKVFACNTPDIFGYCGDVLYPTVILGQLGDLIDRKLLWEEGTSAQTRHNTVLEYLKTSFAGRHRAPEQSFTIIHCARDGESLDSQFFAWTIEYDAKRGDWIDTEISVGTPANSTVLTRLGSGGRALDREINTWKASPQGDTARAIFSAFCDSLQKEGDKLSGGVPQIVSLDRRGGGKLVGFVAGETRYLHGLPVQSIPQLENIEWVDSLFQRISPVTLDLLSNAQRHVRIESAPNGFARFSKKWFGSKA